MTTTAEKTITPRIIALRKDITKYISDEWLKKYKVKQVFQLGVYNEREHTHLCEMEPSYHIQHACLQHVPADDAPEDEDSREVVYEAMLKLDSETEPGEYGHVRSVEKFPLNNRARFGKAQRFVIFTAKDCRKQDMDKDEAMEKAVEYLRGNEM